MLITLVVQVELVVHRRRSAILAASAHRNDYSWMTVNTDVKFAYLEEKMNKRPLARKKDLVIQELPDEVIVYDMSTNKAHCLNPSATFIWRACNGKNSIADIVSEFDALGQGPVSEDFVWLAIDQLQESALLEQDIPPRFSGQSRRQVIKKIGLASMVAVPVIASLVAPQNALATASCACVNPGDCLTQPTCPNTMNCNAATGLCAP